MSVQVYGSIGISARSGAVYIDMSAASPAKEIKQTVPVDIIKSLPWSPWGADNLLPQQYIQDIRTTAVLSGIINGKGRLGVCSGMVPAIMINNNGQKVIDRIVEEAEIVDFLEMNNHFSHTHEWMKDLAAFNWGVTRFMLDGKREKIVQFQRDDVTECRFERKTLRGRINNLYYSADWNRVRNVKDERLFKIPLLDAANPFEDLKKKATAGIAEHAYAFGFKDWGTHYYPVPEWMASYKWVKIAQGVPEMKAALFQNAMRPKMHVIIAKEYWEERYGNEWVEWDATIKATKKAGLL